MSKRRIGSVKVLIMGLLATMGMVGASIALAQEAQQDCTQTFRMIWAQPRVNDHALQAELNKTLECYARRPKLSLLGAQYIVLSRMKLQLVSRNMGSDHEFYLQPSIKPYDLASDPHILYLNLRDWQRQQWTVDQVLDFLQDELFPNLLADRQNSVAVTLGLSFDAAINQAIAFADTPPRGFPESSKNYYDGSLLQPFSYFTQNVSTVPALERVRSDYRQWSQMQSLFRTFSSCPGSKCLMRMEKRIVQGILMMLTHPDLAEALYSKEVPGHLPSVLPKVYGCSGSLKDGENGRPTGYYFKVDTDLPFYVRDGRYGFLGRTLAIQAFDTRQLHDNVLWNQNGIIRTMTAAAAADFEALGGFGANRDVTKTPAPELKVPTDQGIAHALAFAEQKVSGVSLEMVKYWIYKHFGREGEARQVIDRPVFNEMAFSDGQTLRWWVEYGFRRNPSTPYQIVGLDYMYYPHSAGKYTFYDRVSYVLSHEGYLPSWRSELR